MNRWTRLPGATLRAIILRSRAPFCELDLFHAPMRNGSGRCRGCFRQLWIPDPGPGCEACGALPAGPFDPYDPTRPVCDECGAQ